MSDTVSSTATVITPRHVVADVISGEVALTVPTTSAGLWQPPVWDAERINLLRKAIAPPSATAAEVDLFIAWCKRTGLDPFIKQAYLIERWDAMSNTKKHEPMASEQGMAARVDAFPDFRGIKSGVVYAGDVFDVDDDATAVVHKWNIADRTKNGMKIIGAWSHAQREGRVIEVTFLTLESRIGKKKDGSTTRFWATDPAGQLRKCARADQYRRAYPGALAGVYIEAELRRDEDDETDGAKPAAPTPPSAAPNAKTEALKARLAADPKASGAVLPIEFVRFGKAKGVLIADATTVQLVEAMESGTTTLKKAKGDEKWVPALREGLDAIAMETDRRTAFEGTEPREPGAEG